MTINKKNISCLLKVVFYKVYHYLTTKKQYPLYNEKI